MSPILNDAKAPLDVIAFAALSLGMIYVGSCNEEVAQSIIFALMDRSEAQLGDALTRFLPLGLGLLYLGKQVENEFYWISFLFVYPMVISLAYQCQLVPISSRKVWRLPRRFQRHSMRKSESIVI